MRYLIMFCAVVAGNMAGQKIYEWLEDAYQWKLVERAKQKIEEDVDEPVHLAGIPAAEVEDLFIEHMADSYGIEKVEVCKRLAKEFQGRAWKYAGNL